jgi:HSP20 family protein
MNYLTVRRPNNGVSVAGDFDRLFDSVFGNMPTWSDRSPAVDIRANDNEYVVEAELPGLSEDQIDVRVENDLMIIQAHAEENRTETEQAGETRQADETPGDEYILRERRARRFHRSFAMPKDADTGNVEATYRNGVLTVRLPKKPESKPRRIEIKRS